MKSLLHDRIHDLLNEALAFNSNDNLVHVDLESDRFILAKEPMSYVESEVPRKLIKEIRDSIKEKGVNPLCLVEGVVRINLRGNEFNTPVVLTPIRLHHDRVKGEFQFSKTDEPFVNPYLLRTLKEEFDLNAFGIDSHNLMHWLQEKGFESLDASDIIGSFHHHRFEIVRELEDLLKESSFSSPLLQLLGAFEGVSEPLSVPRSNLLPADTDHEAVFSSLSNNNTVVQGPPGTGKTQVLVNVIGKMLLENKRLTVISEKHVALDVVQNKLEELGLSSLAYIAASEHSNTVFIRSLEDSWKFIERYESKQELNLRLSEQYEDRLQNILETINKGGLAGGISYTRFRQYFAAVKNSLYTYRSELPSLVEYEAHSELIKKSYDEKLNIAVGALKKASLEDHVISLLDQKLIYWKQLLDKIRRHFTIEFWSDLELAMKNAADLQIFDNELAKQYSEILEPNSSKRKKFDRLVKQWKNHPLKDRPVAISSHWKMRPSKIELESLNVQLDTGGFIQKLKAGRRWKQLSHLPVSKAGDSIAEELLLYNQEDSYSQLLVKFCDLGLTEPQKEIDLILQLLSYLTDEKWEKYYRVDANERSFLNTFHQEIRELHEDLNKHFRLESKSVLDEVFKNVHSGLGGILSLDHLDKLSNATLSMISSCESFEKFVADLFHSHLIMMEKTYPTLKGFEPSELGSKLNEIIDLKSNESRLLVDEILTEKSKQFNTYHELLTTPARKLSEEEKALKQQLKRGKSILVKEFGKSRQHLSLRELFSSEARFWIQLLKPVWLSNPSFLAQGLPLEQGLFDISIFDESTQIPLQNVLGVIQRSNRVLVAGDEHQMGPTNYFSAGGIETEDLLHQASFHFPSVQLKHHYRSKYADLINFSNIHFYNNELLVFPTRQRRDDVIRYFYVENGLFIDRKNEQEAKQVAEYIISSIDAKGAVGIVAFSETQLSAIWNEIPAEIKTRLEERIENDSWFFKSLENLQGDECDHLVISFGYGKNEEGEFHHRFGPMNLHSGRNRLNVLMTRARESITLFSSIQSDSFKVSDNESVNLLRQFLRFFETYTPSNEVTLPYGLHPSIEDSTIVFEHIYDQFKSARELVTLHQVLRERGWKIDFR